MFSRSIPRFLARGVIALGILLAADSAMPLWAVQVSGGYNTADPGGNIPHWTSGWPGAGLSGWNYVGQVNGASGTYLGNGWVLTAAHVGVGNFVLDGVNYNPVGGSITQIENGSVDLILFQIAPPPSLPLLALGQLPPVPLSTQDAGDLAGMIGFGGGQGKSWGANTVTGVNQPISVLQYTTIDFYTTHGTTWVGGRSVTNRAQAVSGDSGGAGFIFNPSTGKWELVGIMEATGQASFFVQTSAYVQTILDITGVAAPPAIELGPAGTSVTSGSQISLSVIANGSKPLTYQWRKDGNEVPGATAAALTVAHASQSDNGVYSVTVTNSYGSVASAPATVTVSSMVSAMPQWSLAALPLLLLVMCSTRLIREQSPKVLAVED